MSFLPLQEARASVEVAYDDGVVESSISSISIGYCYAVKFSLPDGCTSARLITARVYKVETEGTLVNIHVLGSDGVTELTPPFIYDVALNDAWNAIVLTSKDITVAGDFWVAVEYLTVLDPELGFDTSSTAGRSYFGTPGSWNPFASGNLMIRAVIECSAPVGGVVMPVNKPLVLASYLALAGLIAVVSAVYVMIRRKD